MNGELMLVGALTSIAGFFFGLAYAVHPLTRPIPNSVQAARTLAYEFAIAAGVFLAWALIQVAP